MQPEQWEKVKDVFAAALEEPLALRADLIAELCAGDEAIRGEVESLLAAHEEPDQLLEKNTINLAAQLQTGKHAYDGKRFGSYRILREIGRGGMGTVFLAERADGQFKQEVALKIIRQSFADAELEKHFRRERQILASLNHPNIAKLIDGGVSETGELFLAMEFIAGEQLISFAVAHQLAIEERLQLFLKICHAVSYAHQNLVIHRDLKPSNILVSEGGEPRLLDFGLAKLSDPGAITSGFNSDRTETAFRAFTPAYAAPEQILGRHVTTASDVFSLGVILYELLTNEKPFHFEGKSLDEIIRTVTGGEPSAPSRILKSEDSQAAIQQRQLRGDLDNITLKALQKDPARRYQSVAEFANDIERHLDHLPVSARPNTLAYRVSRFYQRNQIAVSAAALILLALIGGLAVALWQYRNAQRENVKAAVVNDFLKTMLLSADPGSGQGSKTGYQTSVADILAQADKRLDSQELRNQPEVRAELLLVVGGGYVNQGNYDAGERDLKEALAEETRLYGADSPRLVRTEVSLASLFFAKADYDNAESIYRLKIPLLRSEFQQGTVDADFLLANLDNYAVLKRARGDSVAAETLLRESLAISSRLPLRSKEETTTRALLTLILIDRGKLDEAESLQQAEVNTQRSLPTNETPGFCATLTLFGIILMEKGDLSAADANLREAEAVYRKLYSPNFIGLHDNLRLQAQVLYLSGKYEEANTRINGVLENYRQNANPKYISFGTALTVQGLILNKLGRGNEAESVLREAVKLREENLPAKHFMTALSKGALGEVLSSQKRFSEAEPLLVGSYQDLKQSQAPNSPRIRMALLRLVTLYQQWGKPAAADEYRKLNV